MHIKKGALSAFFILYSLFFILKLGLYAVKLNGLLLLMHRNRE